MGIKEYYGLVPAHFSVNVSLLQQYLQSPDASLGDLVGQIAAPYGPSAAPALLEAWEWTVSAMEAFPWNASWALRRIFEHPNGEWQDVPRASWFTPSWQANRRGFYMVTDRADQHPWLKEDVGLRAVRASGLFERAADRLETAARLAVKNTIDVQYQLREVRLAAQVSQRFGEQMLANRAA